MQPPSLARLIHRYGELTTREYLRRRYSKAEHITEYKNLFPVHLTQKSPDFHNEILQAIPQGGKQAIAAPRGFAKSTTINVVGASWLILNSHYHFIVLISDTYTQAKMQLAALKTELETNEVLNWIYGNPRAGIWGEDTIEVQGTNGKTLVMALGAGMKIRGLKYNQYRPELAIIDDLENTELVYSAERRQKLENWFNFDLQPGLAKQKNILYLGTILHYNALLKKVVEKQGRYAGWKTKLYKAIQDGKSLWPQQYPLEYLIQIRDNPDHPDYVGSIVFAQEYQNEPQDDKDRIIKRDWIKEYSYRELLNRTEGDDDAQRKANLLKSLTVYVSVDPAVGQKETSDYFAAYVLGLTREGDELQLDLLHDKLTIDEQVKAIVQLCQDWKADILGIESNAYQAGLYQLVRTALQKAGMVTQIKKIITDKDKIRRARIHSVAFEGGYIKLRTDHPKTEILKTQILEFPMGEHDDALDSLMLARELRIKPKARAFASKPAGF